ncbi:MAG: hypothetical protein ACLQNG_00550, partial [Acidimicrobiales bacterium]
MSITTLRQAVQGRGQQPTESGRRRRPTSLSRADLALLLASAISAVCLVWFVFFLLTLFSGAGGFVIVSIVVFLAIYYFANRQVFDRMVAIDRVIASVVTLGS